MMFRPGLYSANIVLIVSYLLIVQSIIEEKASTSGRPKKKLPGVDVLRAEKKEMTFEQMCKKYNVCRTTLYKILKSGDLHE